MARPAYGQFDPFPGIAAGEAAGVRELAASLERRARDPQQAAIRAAALDLLGIAPGERALDAGCGSGPLARALARRVGPAGRVVGLDPSPAFLAVARELAAGEGLAARVAFLGGDARALPFPDAAFDVALADTVLAHIPGGERALAELARVVRPGGRVGVYDNDSDSAFLAHPDRALTRRIVAAYADHAVVDSWFGRRAAGLLAAAGLEEIGVRAFTVVERDPAGWYAQLAVWRAETAVRAGAVTRGEAERWLGELRAEQAAGRHLAGQTGLFTWGRRPPGT